jgi:hypothetical protein
MVSSCRVLIRPLALQRSLLRSDLKPCQAERGHCHQAAGVAANAGFRSSVKADRILAMAAFSYGPPCSPCWHLAPPARAHLRCPRRRPHRPDLTTRRLTTQLLTCGTAIAAEAGQGRRRDHLRRHRRIPQRQDQLPGAHARASRSAAARRPPHDRADCPGGPAAHCRDRTPLTTRPRRALVLLDAQPSGPCTLVPPPGTARTRPEPHNETLAS